MQTKWPKSHTKRYGKFDNKGVRFTESGKRSILKPEICGKIEQQQHGSFRIHEFFVIKWNFARL